MAKASHDEKVVLYRADTLDRFTNNLMQRPLEEKDFEEDLASVGPDFTLDTLLDTMHQTWINKQVVEALMYRKSLRDLCIMSDDGINELRKLDNQYTGILVSGLDLLFNLSLSELFYRVDEFPDNIGERCREECKKVITDAVGYFRRDIKFNEAQKQFEDEHGERVKRKKPLPFKKEYDAAHNSVNAAELTHLERSLAALYHTFATHYKLFKDDTGLLRACTLDPTETQSSGYDSALVRLVGVKEHLSEIKPNRLSLRYFLIRDIISSLEKTKPGYKIMRELTQQNTDMQAPEWIELIKLTKMERAKAAYTDIKFGSYGKLITNVAIANSLLAVLGNITQFAGMIFPEVKQTIDSNHMLRDPYYLLNHPLYSMAATGLLLGVLDKLPAGVLRREFERTQRMIYS